MSTCASAGSTTCHGSCCPGTGCCGPGGTQCQTQHSNGVGQNYYDCASLATPGDPSTYTPAMAQEARAAFTGKFTGATPSPCTNSNPPSQALLGVSPDGVTFVTWAFSGPLAGRVSTGGVCPDTNSATWN
jgi:hypothetical protein